MACGLSACSLILLLLRFLFVSKPLLLLFFHMVASCMDAAASRTCESCCVLPIRVLRLLYITIALLPLLLQRPVKAAATLATPHGGDQQPGSQRHVPAGSRLLEPARCQLPQLHQGAAAWGGACVCVWLEASMHAAARVTLLHG